MLFELEIIDAICQDLEQQDYIIVSRKKGKRHEGIDIIAKKNGAGLKEFFYIEVVGGTSSDPTSKKFGEPFDSSQCKVHVAEQLYACMELLASPKIEEASYRIGMAFEDNEHYRKYVKVVKNALEDLKIEVLFINENKDVLF